MTFNTKKSGSRDHILVLGHGPKLTQRVKLDPVTNGLSVRLIYLAQFYAFLCSYKLCINKIINT